MSVTTVVGDARISRKIFTSSVLNLLNDLIIGGSSPKLYSYIEKTERTEIKILFYRIRHCIPLVYVTFL